MFSAFTKAVLACSLCLAPAILQAQNARKAKAPSQDPSTYMHVSAPLAQAVLAKVKAQHDGLLIPITDAGEETSTADLS